MNAPVTPVAYDVASTVYVPADSAVSMREFVPSPPSSSDTTSRPSASVPSRSVRNVSNAVENKSISTGPACSSVKL